MTKEIKTRKAIILLRQSSDDNILMIGIGKGKLEQIYKNKKNEDVVLKIDSVSLDGLSINTKKVCGWLFEDIIINDKLIEIARDIEKNTNDKRN